MQIFGTWTHHCFRKCSVLTTRVRQMKQTTLCNLTESPSCEKRTWTGLGNVFLAKQKMPLTICNLNASFCCKRRIQPGLCNSFLARQRREQLSATCWRNCLQEDHLNSVLQFLAHKTMTRPTIPHLNASFFHARTIRWGLGNYFLATTLVKHLFETWLHHFFARK